MQTISATAFWGGFCGLSYVFTSIYIYIIFANENPLKQRVLGGEESREFLCIGLLNLL